MSSSFRGVLNADASWSGDLELTGDVLVPEGRRLIIESGARIGCARPPGEAAPMTRPAFAGRIVIMPRRAARLIVAGELIVRGSVSAPARFAGAHWGGIFVRGRGRTLVRRAVLAGQESSLVAVDFALARLTDCELTGEQFGAVVGGCARGILRRCRFENSNAAGAWADDDARVLLDSCRIDGPTIGACAAGAARLRMKDCAARGCVGPGLSVEGSARADAQGCRFEECAEAVSAGGRSRVEIRSCRAAGGDAAWAALDEARLRVHGSTSVGAKNGLWVQNRARADCADARLEGGDFGLRASHGARLYARETVTQGQATSGTLVENEAFASLRGCADGSARGGPALLDSARAELDGVRVGRETAGG